MFNQFKLFYKLMLAIAAVVLLTFNGSVVLATGHTTVNNPARFNMPGDWNPASIEDGDWILMGNGVNTIEANISSLIAAISNNGQNTDTTINISASPSTFGSISGNGNGLFFIRFNGGVSELTLSGDNVGGIFPSANIYDRLANIDFTNATGTTLFITPFGDDSIQLTSSFTSPESCTLRLVKSLTVTSSTVGNFGQINIGSESGVPRSLTISNTDVSLLGAGKIINFTDQDSSLIFKNDTATTKTLTLEAALPSNFSNHGKVELNAVNGDIMVVGSGGDQSKSLGINGNELKELNIQGAGIINVGVDTYAQTINYSGANKAIFSGNISSNNNNNYLNISSTGTVELQKDLSNRQINFNADGVLALNVNQDITFSPSSINISNGTMGTINAHSIGVGKTLTIQGSIGNNDSNKRLKTILMTGGGDLILKNNQVVVGSIDMRGGDGTLELGGGVQLFASNLLHDADKVTLRITDANNNVNFAAINLGSANNRLKQIVFKDITSAINVMLVPTAINLYANSIVTTGANDGAIAYAVGSGESIIDAPIGTATMPLFGIAVGINISESPPPNPAVIVTIKQPAFLKEGLLFFNDFGKIKLMADITATKIYGNQLDTNPGNFQRHGDLEFINDNPITVTTNQILYLNNILVSGSDVTITGNTEATAIKFTNANMPSTLAVQGNLSSTEKVGSVTSNGDFVHTLAIAKNLASSDTVIGASNNRLTVKLTDNNNLNIDTTNFYAGATTAANGTGNVNFNVDGGFAYNLGTATDRLASINFNNNSIVKGNAFADAITIAAGKTVTFRSEGATTEISSNKLELGGIDTKVIFGDNAIINTPLLTKTADEGLVTFEGNVTVNRNLGNAGYARRYLRTITFAPNKTVTLNHDIHANTINADQAKIKLLSNTLIAGNLIGANVNIDLGSSKLHYEVPTRNTTLTGDLTLNTTFDSVTNTGGQLIEYATTRPYGLNLSEINTLNIVLTANSLLPTINTIYQYNVLQPLIIEDGIIGTPKTKTLTVNEQNRYVEWSNPEGYTLLGKANLDVLLEDVASSNDQVRAAVLVLINQQEVLRELLSNLGSMSPAEARDAITRLLPLDISGEAVPESVDETIKTLTQRLATIIQSVFFSGEIDGIAAGDELQNKHGTWLSTFYGKANQKEYGSNPSYKAITYGSTIGADTMLNEDVTVGASFTLAHTDVKHYDDLKGGDKGKTNTNLFSIYSSKNFANDRFLQGFIFYGLTNIKVSEERNITSLQKQIATAKFKSHAYGGQLLGGTHHQLTRSVAASPMLGIRYNKFDDAAYKETGASIQNLSVAKKSDYILEGIIGGKLIMKTSVGSVVVKPELQAFANCRLKSKTPTISAKLDSMNLPIQTKGAKASPAWYSIGGVVTIERRNMEYAFLYDLELDKKYVSHQGLFKVRVNF